MYDIYYQTLQAWSEGLPRIFDLTVEVRQIKGDWKGLLPT